MTVRMRRRLKMSESIQGSLDLAEALITALEDAETISFIDNTADIVKDNVQELEITQSLLK